MNDFEHFRSWITLRIMKPVRRESWLHFVWAFGHMARFVNKVGLRYYKSIGNCTVSLSDVTILVGPNGSGKSNFLDSLWFISDALSSTLDFAIRQRGGVSAVRKRSGGHPTHFAISVQLTLPSGQNAVYSFQIGAQKDQTFVVQREVASVRVDAFTEYRFEYRLGEMIGQNTSMGMPIKVSADRLALQINSAIPEFAELFSLLSGMRPYAIYPQDFRLPQAHDSGDYLLRTGRNIAAVLRDLQEQTPGSYARIEEYLKRIVPDVEGVEYKSLGPAETVEFKQKVIGQRHPWRFFASQMSDGTLRSVGILVALFQRTTPKQEGLVIGIEEPESTIHPAACATLMDAIREASKHKQIVLTTHSPELIDHKDIQMQDLRIVQSLQGETSITEADSASISMVRDSLMSPGELLRANQIQQSTTDEASRQFSFLESFQK